MTNGVLVLWRLMAIACAMRHSTFASLVFAASLILAASGCSSPPRATSVQQWGSMKVVLRQGRTEARVSLKDVCASDGMVAVGALEGLRGEITVLDGEAWIARAPNVESVVGERTRASGESATLLVASDVDAWQTVSITESVDDELDVVVLSYAKAAGVDVTKPFPFVVEGEFGSVQLHVIRGGCPIANPDGPKPARVHEERAKGRVVGFYAHGSSGDLTHHTSDVHAHVILNGGKNVSGHIDSIRLRAGNTLRLPAR
jgi:acetolactate decarboxylase